MDVDSVKPAGEKSEAEEEATAEKGKMAAGYVKGRAKVDGRAGARPRASRVYMRASRSESSSGDRGVAGHTVRGVKKTGRAIGKTFGKIGEVFHD